MGVNDIGRRSLLTSVIDWFFGIGVTLAHFQIQGSCFSTRDEFIILQRGMAKISEKSLSIQFGILSGPLALDVETRLSCLNTVLGDIEGRSKLVVSSLFVCDMQGCIFLLWLEKGGIYLVC